MEEVTGQEEQQQQEEEGRPYEKDAIRTLKFQPKPEKSN